MLKVYNVYECVSVNGGDWRQVGDSGYTITDEELSERIILDNASFIDTIEYLKNKFCFSIRKDKTFFKHKPIIKIGYNGAWDYAVYRGFDTLSYKIVYEEWEGVTMQWLMEHASANQVIQYLKERGITTCPMNF